MHLTREPVPAEAGAGWQQQLDPTALRRMAQAALHLFEQPDVWIHRRVERVYFKDHQMAHHQVSVDFTLPARVSPIGWLEERPVYVAPLFLLVKDSPKPLREGQPAGRRLWPFSEREGGPYIPTAPYSNLSFRDEHGRSLPLLTRRQSGLLASMMLLETAGAVLGQAPRGRLGREVALVARRSWFGLEDVMEWLLTERVRAHDSRAMLRRDEKFVELAHTLASHSVVVCLLGEGALQRSVYKLSYDEPANEKAPNSRWAPLRSLGWRSEQYSVSLNEIGAAASYHLEIEVPEELEITAVSLFGKRYSSYGDLLADKDREYAIQQVGSTNEGKIYIPQPLPGRRVGMAWVKLRGRRAGFLTGALFASFTITVLLALGAGWAPSVVAGNRSDPATAALLLVPAVLAAYVARTGEHAITKKMLRWVRFLLVCNALLPALAVFFLIITHDSQTVFSLALGPVEFLAGAPGRTSTAAAQLQLEWAALAGASAIFTLVFVLSTVLPWPHGRTVYRPMPAEIEPRHDTAEDDGD